MFASDHLEQLHPLFFEATIVFKTISTVIVNVEIESCSYSTLPVSTVDMVLVSAPFLILFGPNNNTDKDRFIGKITFEHVHLTSIQL